MTDYLLGLDISRHNGAIDYHKCAAAGVKFAAIRCTVGDYYTDPCFETHWDGFREIGISTTAYHIVVPSDSNG